MAMSQTTETVPAWESPYFTGFDDPTAVAGTEADAGVSRRQFVKVLGAGLLIAAGGVPAAAQVAPGGRGNRGGGRGGGGGFRGGGRPTTFAARLHVGKDGVVTVMTGKVECGQGARAELTQSAAEELRLAADRVLLVMADTGLVPDDGMTAGSRSTPSTVPAIRQAAAAARELLADLACKRWTVQRAEVEVKDGKVVHAPSARELSYADLANAEDGVKAFALNVPQGVTVTPVKEWRVMGTPVARPNRRDLVTGGHHYPSDIIRPGMLYGKVLRPSGYGATLKDVDLGPAKAMKDVLAVRDGPFVAVAAPTSFLAKQALEAVEKTAQWDAPPHVSSADLFDHLRKNARGGVPKNPFADDVAKAAKSVRATYHVAYVQHAPLEPRAAVAEWEGNKLTVWTGTQNPFGVRGELVRALNVPESDVRVIVPDFGGGFGGKHSGEAAVEAARLARAVGKPVSLRWTRREEFTWAYFRPAGVIDAEAGLDAGGKITSWHFVNVNSGPSAVEAPYRIAKSRSQFVGSDAPLKQGSYRALASTANTFARECFMDELAEAAGQDPLAFRLAHIEEPRLRGVLEEAAKQFDWAGKSKQQASDGDVAVAVGLSCGTEKGSFVAACAEVAVDRKSGKVKVRRVTQAFDCGAVINPANLTSQVEGAICMGLGPLLREEIRFEGGRVTNAAFAEYLVPRFEDVPAIDVHLINPQDASPIGAGETPIIAVGPAVANAVSRATGKRVREMPMRVEKAG